MIAGFELLSTWLVLFQPRFIMCFYFSTSTWFTHTYSTHIDKYWCVWRFNVWLCLSCYTFISVSPSRSGSLTWWCFGYRVLPAKVVCVPCLYRIRSSYCECKSYIRVQWWMTVYVCLSLRHVLLCWMLHLRWFPMYLFWSFETQHRKCVLPFFNQLCVERSVFFFFSFGYLLYVKPNTSLWLAKFVRLNRPTTTTVTQKKHHHQITECIAIWFFIERNPTIS